MVNYNYLAVCVNITFIIDIKPNGCTNGDVRLVSRTSAGSGIVQICVNGTWSSLCSMSSSFDMNEAVVMCRKLGFQTNGGLSN